MKTTIFVARLLLGLVLTVSGLNGFLHFLPMFLPSSGTDQFMEALTVSRYLVVVSALQLKAGTSLLLNRYVPLALAVLGPIVVNILLYHLLINPNGLAFALFVAVLWALVVVNVRSAFAGIFQKRVAPEAGHAQYDSATLGATNYQTI